MSFEIDLMMETSQKLSESIFEKLDALAHIHGFEFSRSVLGNVGCLLLTTLLSAEEDESKRLTKLLSIVHALSINVMSDVAGIEADKIIERIKRDSKC